MISNSTQTSAQGCGRPAPTPSPEPTPRDALRHILLLVLVVVGLVLVFRLTPLRVFTSLDTIITWVESARGSAIIRWGYFLIYPILILAIPIAIFPILGGILFPFWLAFPLNMLAILTGATIAYWIGRLLGKDMLAPLLGRRVGAFKRFRAENGFTTVLLIRWIGLPPFLITNYAFGFTGFRFPHYISGTALGVMPWTAITTYMAGALWEALITGHQNGLKAALHQFMEAPFWVFSAFLVIVILVSRHIRAREVAGNGEPEI